LSLASPLWLLALALIPLAILAQAAARRRGRRYAVRFPAVGTLQQALAERESWTRHLPAAAALAAVAALVLALAGPRVPHRVAVGEASIVLVTDHSGSMAATDVQPTRLGAAERAANTFIDQLPSSVRVGVVTFSTSPDATQAPVTNHALARQIIDSQDALGGTDTGDALALALQLLRAGQSKHPPGAVVLLSDGAANLGQSPVGVAAQAKRDHVPIYTVALGTPRGTLGGGPFSPPVSVPPDPQLMTEIASVSGARAFTAQSADQLSSIYRQLGRRLGSVTRKRDITPAFAIAGAVLLLGAGVLSIRTSGRIV
jgi:Ca-activated chloride channel family protein